MIALFDPRSSPALCLRRLPPAPAARPGELVEIIAWDAHVIDLLQLQRKIPPCAIAGVIFILSGHCVKRAGAFDSVNCFCL